LTTEDEGSFFSRWSRRKVQARQVAGEAPAAALPEPEPNAAAPSPATPATTDAPAAPPAIPAPAAEALPTMADVALLNRDSDYAPFVARGLDEKVKHAAMKKLFSDPHFNVMDGLDTYIDDYGKPDPIPLAMLRRMNQSAALGLFEHEDAQIPNNVQDRADDGKRHDDNNDNTTDSDEKNERRHEGKEAATPPPGLAPATPSGPHLTPHDDDADLQLQPDDAAGRPGPGQGAGP